MTIHIVRFAFYGSPTTVDAYFRSGEKARDIMARIGTAGLVSFDITDDFGIAIRVHPSQCACVLTSTEASAAIQKALMEANHDAARAYGLTPGIATGSTH